MLNQNHRICTSFRIELTKVTQSFIASIIEKESTVFG